jgi:hypothetical protein
MHASLHAKYTLKVISEIASIILCKNSPIPNFKKIYSAILTNIWMDEGNLICAQVSLKLGN